MMFLDSLKEATKIFLGVAGIILGFLAIATPIGLLITNLVIWVGLPLAMVYCILLVATMDYVLKKRSKNVR